MRRLLTFAATILALAVVLATTVIAMAPPATRLAASMSGDPTNIDMAALDSFAVRSEVYASDGSLLAQIHGPENRKPVPLDRVPKPVVEAILSVEDANFYAHNGVNFRAMTRALFENVSSGGIEQGGSTITQQLVKNALLTSARDLDRKSKEIPLALRLEQELTKDQILEKYLNAVYFGSGAYGVQAAAETYWGVDVDQLGVAEGAMLAALIANPVAYDPTLHPDAAYERRHEALGRMETEGYITHDQAVAAGAAPLPVRGCGAEIANRPETCGDVDQGQPENYFVEQVKQELLKDPRLGATEEDRKSLLLGGGLRIYTTLDPRLQFAARLAQAKGVPPNDKGVTAAMVTLENSTGAVRALVGGPGYDTFQYDIVTHPPGQPTGSAFKLFTLLTALEQGNSPFDTIQGAGRWPCPSCDNGIYDPSGPGGSLQYVTQRSSNGAFVRLAQVVGINNVIDTAHALGVTTDLTPDLSMTLGPQNITPIEMASAYSAVADGGVRQPAYFIDRVETRDGKVLFEHQPDPQPGVSEQSACYATQILQSNVTGGTGTRARLTKQPAAGKTGTTENNFDAWFVGFTPYYTTAIWMGNPQQDISMENLNGVANFGGTYPAMMWRDFNEAVHRDLPVLQFPDCAKVDHSARPVIGQGNPFLNGVRFDKNGKPYFTGSTDGSTRSSRSARTTTAPTDTTTPDGGGGGDQGGGSPPSSQPPPSSTSSTAPSNGGGNGGGNNGG